MNGNESMGLKSLVEAVILQAIGDLWSKTNRDESIEFFFGEGLSLCAATAGLKPRDLQLLNQMISGAMQRTGISRDGRKSLH